MSGPASPGQQVCTGSRARSTSAPSQTISWHGPVERSFGAMCSTCMNTGRVFCHASLQALRRLGLLEKREQLADLAQRRDRVLAHAHRHALRRAEQVAEDRHRVALGLLEQQRRAAGLQHAVADLGHLEPRIDGGRDALQLAAAFELREEVAEVGVFHGIVARHAR